MSRACSADSSDLNRDPDVRRTYRRNVYGRLESIESEGKPSIIPRRDEKRRVIHEGGGIEPTAKRHRTTRDKSVAAGEAQIQTAYRSAHSDGTFKAKRCGEGMTIIHQYASRAKH